MSETKPQADLYLSGTANVEKDLALLDKLGEVAQVITGSSGRSDAFDHIRAVLKHIYTDSVAPFVEGDRVELTRTPVITESHSWGWLPYKKLLVAGAKGKVAGVRMFNTGWAVNVVFDPRDNAESTDGVFCFDPSDLRIAEAEAPAPVASKTPGILRSKRDPDGHVIVFDGVDSVGLLVLPVLWPHMNPLALIDSEAVAGFDDPVGHLAHRLWCEVSGALEHSGQRPPEPSEALLKRIDAVLSEERRLEPVVSDRLVFFEAKGSNLQGSSPAGLLDYLLREAQGSEFGRTVYSLYNAIEKRSIAWYVDCAEGGKPSMIHPWEQ